MNIENTGAPGEGRRRFIGAAIAAIPGTAMLGTGSQASGEASLPSRTAGPVKQPAVTSCHSALKRKVWTNHGNPLADTYGESQAL
jgi:hypothetical protein